MRVIKQRLIELLPGIQVFLDVDDLQRKVGDLNFDLALDHNRFSYPQP